MARGPASGLSLRAYAAHRRSRGLKGHTLRAVQKALETDRIEKNSDGGIDPEVADQMWAERTDPSKVRGKQAGEGEPRAKVAKPRQQSLLSEEDQGNRTHNQEYYRSRAQRENAEAQLRELTLREKLGELIPFQVALQHANRVGANITRQLEAQGPRLSNQIAGMSDPAEIEELLNKENRRIAESFVEDPRGAS